MLIGKYENTNYDYGYSSANYPDTLMLYENNRFASKYWGKGKYTINSSLRGTCIEFNLEFGGKETYISRFWFGKPRIEVNEDFNHFYMKIK